MPKSKKAAAQTAGKRTQVPPLRYASVGMTSQPRSPGAPHPRFPVEFRGFPELYAPFLKERRTRGPFQSCVQEIRGISLVSREMWDTAGLPLNPVAGSTGPHGCPTFAPALPGFPTAQHYPRPRMRLSLKESRMKLLSATNLDRKSGIRGPKKMGEALRQNFLPVGNRTSRRRPPAQWRRDPEDRKTVAACLLCTPSMSKRCISSLYRVAGRR
jgi:hypothetical protein